MAFVERYAYVPAAALAVLLAVLAGVALLPAGASAGEWLFGFSMVPDSAEPHPALAMNGSGEAALAFASNGVRVSLRPAGGVFERPEWGGVRVSGEGIEGQTPAVAIDSRGDVVVVWEQDTASQQIYEAVRPAGGSFGVPQLVSSTGKEVGSLSVAINEAGETTVAWLGEQEGSKVVKATTAPFGGSYPTAVSLSGAGANAIQPQALDTASGKTIVYWSRPDASGLLLEVAARDAGGRFRAPDSHGDGEILGEMVGAPSLAADPTGEAIATWRTPSGQIAWARMPDGSDTFENPSVLGNSSGPPWAAINEHGEAVIAWPSANTVQVATAPPADGFGTPVEVAAEFAPNAAHVTIGASGSTAVEWERTGSAELGEQGTSRPPGGSFGKPTGFYGSPRAPAEGSLEVASDSAGDLLAVWGEPGFFEDMTSMSYDAGPQLGAITAPEHATVGQSVAFSTPTPSSIWMPLKTVSWSFGDGTHANGTTVAHAYSAPGTYHVTLTAEDTQGTGLRFIPEDPELVPQYVSNQTSQTVVVSAAAPSSGQSLSALSIHPSSFRAANTGPSAVTARQRLRAQPGATVRFALTRAGQVAFSVVDITRGVRRHGKCAPAKSHSTHAHSSACPYTRTLGHFSLAGSAGADRFDFTGRINGRKLRAGRYLLVARAQYSHQAPAQVAFRVLAH
ncbi:MAG TPA: PKD domain-containing protein [Solirubrobacteraceae bacterium]|nr:PKD domain-containing protein [Solirubrobacteraceae bacterium]